MAYNYMTKAGYDKLVAEINELETIQRPEISRQIAEARDKGDLSENAEYDAAKEAQGLLEAKMGLTEPEAFRWIQKTSMDRRLTMREVADAVIEQVGSQR